MTITPNSPRTNHSIGQDFILAGAAIFTLVGSSTRFTFRVTRKDPEAGSRYTQPTYFVGLLTGSNNDTDYSYLGLLDPVTGYVRLTKNSRMKLDAPAVKAIQWALPKVWARTPMPPAFAIMHEGRCGRCGRTLTVPESIISGFGPDCAKTMGLAGGLSAAVTTSLADFDSTEVADAQVTSPLFFESEL